MKKIGITTSGSVIVEMTQAQYDALATFQTPTSQPVVSPAAEAIKMSASQKVTYVKERIIKLKPKKRDGVVRSITSMFQFTGGINDQEIEKIIGSLQKEAFLIIDSAGKVKYKTA